MPTSQYIKLCKFYHRKESSNYCYGILRITNIVTPDTIQLVLQTLQTDPARNDLSPPLQYLLQINSTLWKEEKYEKQYQQLVGMLLQLKKNEKLKKKEVDLVGQVLLKLQLTVGNINLDE